MSTNERIVLRTLLGDYPSTHAVRSGSVRSDRLELSFADIAPPHRGFKRVVRELDFDLAELAIVTFLQARAWGKPLVLLPVVVGPGRFQHHCLVHDAGRGPLAPHELAGKKIGVRSYSQTTVVWLRGILAEDYGVDPAAVRWVTLEDGHLAEYRDPPGVERAAAGRDLIDLLLAGEIDAAILGSEPPAQPRIQPLIPDAPAAALAWSRRRRAVPINHMLTLRADRVRSDPELAREVFGLFCRGRQASPPPAGPDGLDMTPLGLAASRRSLEIAIDWTYRQGLLPRAVTVEELFDETTRALEPA